jgi:fatty acid desaturase
MENVPDFRKSVRSMTLPPIAEFLYWRMNWHTEHHMYAGVPCYHLKSLYHEIAHDMPEPRSLVGAWREMRMIWRRQKVEPGYVFDTPLPPTARPAPVGGATSATELEASIGDLAPKGLSG